MRQQRISEQEVEDVLAHHYTRYTDRQGNPILIGSPGGRRIKVVVGAHSDPPSIITVADWRKAARDMEPRIEYDRKVDALYIYLADKLYSPWPRP